MKKNILKLFMVVLILIPFLQGVVMVQFILSGENSRFINDPDYEFSGIYGIMLDLITPTVFVILIVILINIIYLHTSGKVPEKKRTLWSGLIVLGNIWAAPFFWYWYIWKEKNN